MYKVNLAAFNTQFGRPFGDSQDISLIYREVEDSDAIVTDYTVEGGNEFVGGYLRKLGLTKKVGGGLFAVLDSEEVKCVYNAIVTDSAHEYVSDLNDMAFSDFSDKCNTVKQAVDLFGKLTEISDKGFAVVYSGN